MLDRDSKGMERRNRHEIGDLCHESHVPLSSDPFGAHLLLRM